jgi:hypothetical protein
MCADVLPAPAHLSPAERPSLPEPIRLIRASAGNAVRPIPVSEVICLEAADKYVTVVTPAGESQVRMPLRELAKRLAGIELVQIHRGVMVNAERMVLATRGITTGAICGYKIHMLRSNRDMQDGSECYSALCGVCYPRFGALIQS